MFSEKKSPGEGALERVKRFAALAGYSSPDEFVAHVLEKELAVCRRRTVTRTSARSSRAWATSSNGDGTHVVCGELRTQRTVRWILLAGAVAAGRMADRRAGAAGRDLFAVSFTRRFRTRPPFGMPRRRSSPICSSSGCSAMTCECCWDRRAASLRASVAIWAIRCCRCC